MSRRLSSKTIERKDGWTPELDQVLLDTVTEGLSEGLTQVACFAKAAQRIGKSKSACAFRFNTAIRKQAQEAIERAKQLGKNKKDNLESNKTTQSEMAQILQEASQSEQPSIEAVIHMLQKIQQHNGLAEENVWKRKWNQIEQLVTDSLQQVDLIRNQLQSVLEEIHSMN
jgi:prespore-specific regulator